MKNKNLIYFFAISLSLIFSIFYLLVFHYYIPSNEDKKTATLYLHQIGLYKEKANAEQMNTDLNANQIIGYIYKKDDVYVVACGVSTDEAENKKIEDQLKAHSYSYISKQINVSDDEIAELLNEKSYQKALELIGNQD
ncbi:MAG: hypothetical protein PHQ89_05320 [Bacilli bacterium]|nr:hypothetical protein [Bacilli bacterium]